MKSGEAGFLQGREMGSDLLASSTGILPGAHVTSTADIAEVFSEQQLKELTFCAKKERKAQIEQLLLGVAHASEHRPELIQLMEETCAKLAQTQKERHTDQRRVQKKTTQKEAALLNFHLF